MSLLSTALLHAGSKKSMECKRSALKPKVYDLFFFLYQKHSEAC